MPFVLVNESETRQVSINLSHKIPGLHVKIPSGSKSEPIADKHLTVFRPFIAAFELKVETTDGSDANDKAPSSSPDTEAEKAAEKKKAAAEKKKAAAEKAAAEKAAAEKAEAEEAEKAAAEKAEAEKAEAEKAEAEKPAAEKKPARRTRGRAGRSRG